MNPYKVFHGNDITDQMSADDRETNQKVNNQSREPAGQNQVHTFPIKLEVTAGVEGHLKDQFKANQFFSSPEDITQELGNIIVAIFVN